MIGISSGSEVMPFNLGLPEIVVLLALALLLVGPKRLPELGKSLGESLANFKRSMSTDKSNESDASTGSEAKGEENQDGVSNRQ
jgi:TatA/E family protein of Tat protein translocase